MEEVPPDPSRTFVGEKLRFSRGQAWRCAGSFCRERIGGLSAIFSVLVLIIFFVYATVTNLP
ncbi:MAG: hypothetical protein J6T24_06100, partial [Clostridia bacterium]|nr:hypothetical protein [Clostridia bacterium]